MKFLCDNDEITAVEFPPQRRTKKWEQTETFVLEDTQRPLTGGFGLKEKDFENL
jgi:hypothetical protein